MNTYKKYKNMCISEGMTKMEGEHLQIISLKEILIILNDGVTKERNLMFNRHLRFFKFHKYNTKVTFKLIYNQIVESILIKNFEQQDYNIKLTKKLKSYLQFGDRVTRNEDYYKTLSLAKKKASKRGMSVEQYVDSTTKRCIGKIVTGKYHSSRLIKMSPSSSKRILKRMQSKNSIRLWVKTADLGTVHSQEQLDKIEIKTGFIVITKGRIKHSLGTTILLSSSVVGVKK